MQFAQYQQILLIIRASQEMSLDNYVGRVDTCVCKETHPDTPAQIRHMCAQGDTFRQSRQMCLQRDTFRHIQTKQTHVSASRHIQTHLDRADTCVCKQTNSNTFRQSRHKVDVGRCNQMQVDVGRGRQKQVDVIRCRQMQVDVVRSW